jgi:hypothetical protein
MISLSFTISTSKYPENAICNTLEIAEVQSSATESGSNENLLTIQRMANPARHNKRIDRLRRCFIHDEYIITTNMSSIIV